MSAPGFVFPPPPPPPPPQASHNYPAYPTNTQHNEYSGRGNRGGRDSHGRGAGNSRRGSRGNKSGGIGGYPRHEGHSSTTNDAYITQVNYNAAGGYPLPEYPAVQQPQYPLRAHQSYGPTPLPSYPVQPIYPTHQQGPPRSYNGAPNSTGYPHYPSPQNVPYPPPERQDRRAMDRSCANSSGQPVLMGPPIRWGFEGGYPGGDHRSPTLTHTYPRPAEDRAPPYHNDSRGNRQPYRHNSPGISHSTRHDSPNPFPGQRNRGQKRGHSDAFGGSKKSNPKPQVASVVPSFGIPLPTKPPAPQENGRKRKKKRKHNQLGLTPRTEEHESSEEEDDVDEETKLAAAVGPGSEQQQVHFTYKGQTATLGSSADITAFIEERKKRFPTKERREEAAKLKREKQEAQRAADQTRKKALEKQKAEFRAKQSAEAKETKEKKKKQAEKEQAEAECNSAVSKAKSKMEKLRRQLEKEEKRIAKAEAKAAKTKHKNDKDDQSSLQNHAGPKKEGADNGASANSTSINESSLVKVELTTPIKIEVASTIKQEDDSQPKVELSELSKTTTALGVIDEKIVETQSTGLDPLTPTSQPSVAERDMVQIDIQNASLASELPASLDSHPKSPTHNHISGANEKTEESSLSMSTTTSNDSDLSISTDSDSEDSSSSSSSSSDEEAPETAPSTRTAPDRVPPPKKSKSKAICRNFLKGGRCRRGDACHFRHELPERGSQAANRKKEGKIAEVKTERKGLYQRLVEQEKEKEDLQVLAAIVHLGEKGMFQEKVPTENDLQENVPAENSLQLDGSSTLAGDEEVEAVV